MNRAIRGGVVPARQAREGTLWMIDADMLPIR